MSFQAARLRSGEIVAALGGIVLLVALLAFPWYGVGGALGAAARLLGASTTRTGWQALSGLRWLVLVTIAAALALGWFQGTRRAPALPVVLSVLVTVLASVSTAALIWRVLIELPYSSPLVGARAGAYLGLACAALIAYGGLRSLREEDGPDARRAAAIPTLRAEDLAPPGQPGGERSTTAGERDA